MGKGDSITGHSHKNCEFSGILYFDKQENYENQPPLTFENPLRKMTMYQTSNMAVINGYQSDWSRSPEEGLILFWPAYISHSCETKTERWSDKNRRSLAFNFTPTGFYGTADSTTVSNSSIFNGFLHLGGEFYNGSLTVRSKMHMSNFRIVRKTALYTSNFTPPDRRLEVIPETAILCCQSSSDVTEEATGKKIYAERADNAGSSSNVQASRFTPNSPVGFSTTSDVGSQ